jgi:hypothetical protein
MVKKKNVHSLKENVIKKKIDEIKLEAHVDAVKKNRHTDISKELKYHTSKLRNAIDKTVL